MSTHSFLTIKTPSEGIYKEKNSKFLSFAYPILSEDDAKEKITLLKKKYFDARHCCYAFVIGVGKNRQRTFDDGEPNHSAGDSILGQLRAKNLTNVLIVVVRYFGGVKLGIGTLTQAYKLAAENSLANAIIEVREVHETYLLDFGYEHSANVMKIVKEFDLSITKQTYSESCVLEVEIATRHANTFFEKVELLNKLNVTIGLRKVD